MTHVLFASMLALAGGGSVARADVVAGKVRAGGEVLAPAIDQALCGRLRATPAGAEVANSRS